MKRLGGLVMQELTLALRNAFMPVLIFVVILMTVTVRFVLPEEWSPAETYYFVDRTPGKAYETALEQGGVGANRFLPDEEALRKAVGEKPDAIGVLFAGSPVRPEITIFHSERVSEKGLYILKAMLSSVVESVAKSRATSGNSDAAQTISGGPSGQTFSVRFLRPKRRPVPANLMSVPGLLAFEVLVIGFTFVAVFMFQEKSDGTIRAYRVSPGTTGSYIIAKTLAFVIIGVLYGCGLVLSTVGLGVNYGRLTLMMGLGIVFYTLVGISVASFFKDLSEWFLPGVLLLVLNMMPAISLLFPTFSPRWLTYIPSYPVTFALSEILFPSGKSLLPFASVAAAETVAAYAVAWFLTERNLMKEDRS